MKIAIIGAGASGLLSALLLCEKHEVFVFERNDRPGRKLLASGNGKANISNLNIDSSYYNNSEFVSKLFNKVPKEKVFDLFKKIGIFTLNDNEGRIYPYSLSSQTVLDKILEGCKNVKFIYNFNVDSLVYNNGWKINDYNIIFDHVICSSGSIAGIPFKKQKGVYEYLPFITFTKLKPSLCGFKVKENIKDISGVRAKVKASLLKNDEILYSEAGEVIFKDDGISGIVIMNLEDEYCKYYNEFDKFEVSLDLLNNIELLDILDFQIDGIVNNKLARFINNKDKLKDFRLTIVDTYSFSDAQVVCGGICLDEITDLLFYKKNKTLHFGGEILDVNGKCGGYNLHFAFACAILNEMVINDEY